VIHSRSPIGFGWLLNSEVKDDLARRWWVLAFQLPAQPGYARVKVWRRLQAVGAASFKSALYWLPATEDALEDFEWILREVREAGGDGCILDAHPVQGFSDEEIVALFDAAREEQYRAVADEIKAYLERFQRKRERPTLEEAASQHARFHSRLTAIESIDFFQANGRQQARALLRELEPYTIEVQSRSEEPIVQAEGIGDLKGRTWVTRANVHVDRMASAWLIRRRIDPEARFKFVAERQYRPAPQELRFDMYDAEFTHDGDRCTFEVLVDRFAAGDAGLSAIAQIVHDLDIKDQKFGRKETAGVQQILAGIVDNNPNDEIRLERAAQLFDDLYRSFVRGR
jgi:hypothetical protein